MKVIQMPETKTNANDQILYIAFEMGNSTWGLAFSNGCKIRYKTINARSLKEFEKEKRSAMEHFGLPEDIQIISCYEAGRDGFWLHRHLRDRGIMNLVVDSSSIEVNRKARREKTDKLDAYSLVRMLFRFVNGETQVWSVLRVPSRKIEDERRLHRELERLQKEQTAHVNRIRSLLISQAIVVSVVQTSPEWLQACQVKSGYHLKEGLIRELTREMGRLAMLREQIKEVLKERATVIKEGSSESAKRTRKLAGVRGIGPTTSWNLVHEFLWRTFQNRKEVASAAGLAPACYQSGKMDHDLGISKAGNRRIRSLMVEISWLWLRYQPQSSLTIWFQERFGMGSKRIRKVGIVALARKLLVALWKYLEKDILPLGAVLK
jgi:transposase